MRIVRPRQICPIGTLCWNCFVLGVLFYTPFLASHMIPVVGQGSTNYTVNWLAKTVVFSAFFMTAFVAPAVCLAIWRVQVQTMRRRLAAILFASIGMSSPMLGLSCLGATNGAPKMLLMGIPIVAAVFIAWAILAWPAWWWIRRIWPVTMQDGQTCPKCGHCLRGAASGRCPECGRIFNQYELGLSWDEFQKTKSAQ